MDADAYAEILPCFVRRVDGGVQRASEGQTSAVPEGQAEGASLQNKISRGFGVLWGKGYYLAHEAPCCPPRTIRIDTPGNHLAVNFGEIYCADRGCTQDLWSQFLSTRFTIQQGEER